MSGINSAEDICNLACGHMGIIGNVNNITTPTNPKEVVFSLWYDICRQTLLKNVLPNCALKRDTIASIDGDIPFPYENMFPLPNDCLKLLGIDDIDRKGRYPFALEKGVILIEGTWTNGLPIRYVEDLKIVTSMSVEFKFLLSLYLAAKTVMPITQSLEKKKLVEALLPAELVNVSGLNAQENPPIRVSHSRYREARLGYLSRNLRKQ